MKYVIVLGDGMADRPIAALGDRTPLEAADTPMMDSLAQKGRLGMVHTIPDGMAPGSDTANLSVLGYDPRRYYSGRSPLEALSIGIPMEDDDIAVRTNFVTLSEEEAPFEERTILDHSSGEISTKDCAILLDAVKREMQDETHRFYVGTGYRHCMIIKHGHLLQLTPPHDILGQAIGPYLPADADLARMMRRSYQILSVHPVNLERKRRGLNPANCLWFWGTGTKPALSSFFEKTGKRGVMISAVDLLKGIGTGAGMRVIPVEGADGSLHTNYEGKAQAALDALLSEGADFAYIHVEAPDEMGHQGSAEKKVESIEYLDGRLVRPLVTGLRASGQAFRLLILPDHATPVSVRTHTTENVPFLLYDSSREERHSWHYNEREAAKSGLVVTQGHRLIDLLFED